MCGISAVIALSSIPSSQLNKPSHSDHVDPALDRSLYEIRHRGPNDKGQWHSRDGRVGSQMLSRGGVTRLTFP